MKLIATLFMLCAALQFQDGTLAYAELKSWDNDAQLQHNLARKFNGQVVYIETYRYRGYWLTSVKTWRRVWWGWRFNGWGAKFTCVAQKDVINKPQVKWRIRDVGGGAIAIESVQHPRHYLDAHHTKMCKVTYSSYPNNKSWARFVLEKENGRYMFRSVRYPGYRLDAHHSKWARITKGKGIWSQFRIYQPPKSDHYRELVENAYNRGEFLHVTNHEPGMDDVGSINKP